MMERLLRPVIAWIHIAALVQGLRENSMMAWFAVFWYLWGMISTYNRFLCRFPYAAGNIWAAVLLDNCYPIVDLWACLTLGTEAYGTRNPDNEG
ncbi:hypothetical protein CkaCkLH20_05215 [Colletotrichum karsti]|uniref:Uncharacterized protein n=1 Tax=Colletotrichum karsti TaxID=1095194 RepID=A0A9P6LLR4_9PEZI|nr:uncharacterized protein CkaCkLH20_05215 [Colletotrichum karsti]KAF9877515.1 hypothetical protein CkaCkLH20_05215 [Colletotrichum karsti]